MKQVRSFSGDNDFYRRSIKDFSNIDKPLCQLLIKEKLITTLVNISLDWELPFELKFDATDSAVGAMLGQQNDK